MRYVELVWKSRDGLEMFSREWKPDRIEGEGEYEGRGETLPDADTPVPVGLGADKGEGGAATQGAVCLVHGLGEHSGRYVHVAEAFTSLGYAVLAFDLRGHGKSGGARGHAPSNDALMADIEMLLSQAKERFPDQPCYLYGHSLGGNLVINYVLHHKPALTGVIVTSPWLRLAFEPSKIKVKLGRLVNRVWPSLSQPSGLITRDLSRDPLVVEKYIQDPFIHNRITVRLFTELFDAGEWALQHAGEWKLPLLLMHGSADRITSPEASQLFVSKVCNNGNFSKSGLVPCTFRLWEGLFHEIHNEPQQREVFDYINSWMSQLEA